MKAILNIYIYIYIYIYIKVQEGGDSIGENLYLYIDKY